MLNKKIHIQTLFIICLILIPLTVSAHPGRTDAYGCHTCRTNCAKWGLDSGEYHCHNAKALPRPLLPVASHKTGVTEPAPQYAKPAVQPVVEKPAVKPEPRKVAKPIEEIVVKPVVTSTPVTEQKPAALAPTKESWWSKMKKWF